MNTSRLTSLFHSLERLTKTDLQYLLRGGSWLFASQVITAGIALAVTVAFGHFVPRDSFGTYRFLQSVLWTLTALSLTGIPTALLQAVARGFEGVYRRAFLLSLKWGLPMAFAGAVGAIWYHVNGNMELALGLLCIAIVGPLMQPAYFFGAYLEGKKDFRTEALFGIILALVPALLAGLCMLFTSSPLIFLAAYLIGNVGTGFALDWYVLVRYRPNKEVNPEFVSLSGHFSVMNILWTLSQQIDKLLVFHFLGAVDLAVYAFATAIPEQLRNTLNSVTTLAFPKFAKRPMTAIQETLWFRLFLFTCALAVLALLYILAAPFLFHILFPEYPDAIRYSQLFALSLLGVGSTIPTTLLQAHGTKRELYVLSTVSPIFQILLLIALIPGFGLMGAVVARIVGRIASLVLGCIVVYRYRP